MFKLILLLWSELGAFLKNVLPLFMLHYIPAGYHCFVIILLCCLHSIPCSHGREPRKCLIYATRGEKSAFPSVYLQYIKHLLYFISQSVFAGSRAFKFGVTDTSCKWVSRPQLDCWWLIYKWLQHSICNITHLIITNYMLYWQRLDWANDNRADNNYSTDNQEIKDFVPQIHGECTVWGYGLRCQFSDIYFPFAIIYGLEDQSVDHQWWRYLSAPKNLTNS